MLIILHCLTAALRLSPPDMMVRKVEWSRLSSLLKSYDRLYHHDQVFLLEVGP